MQNQIPSGLPNGLRTTFLVQFIWFTIFGLAGTLAPTLVGNLAGHPVHDIDVNMSSGVSGLAFALASWFAYRAARWEQVSIITAVFCFAYLVTGVGGIVLFLAPSLFGSGPLPAVLLLVAGVHLLFGVSCLYFYVQVNGLRSPLNPK